MRASFLSSLALAATLPILAIGACNSTSASNGGPDASDNAETSDETNPFETGPLPDGTIPPLDLGIEAFFEATAPDLGQESEVLVDATPTFSDLTNAAKWATFDLTALDPHAAGFSGGAFDGRYVYFVPYKNSAFSGDAARFDTHDPAGFASASAFETFDMSTLNAAALGYSGAAFDGRYVYFVPYQNASGTHGLVVRFDTFSSLSFEDASAYTFFDLTTVAPTAAGFVGATFDHQFVYFTPASNGLLTRFDPKASAGFTAAAAYSTFDLTTIDAHATGYAGATFDGRYLYLSPAGVASPSGVAARYDTIQSDAGADAETGVTASFTATSAYATFDTTKVTAGASAFAGAAFDGRYVYFIPGADDTIARFDTTAAAGFGATSAYATFTATQIDPRAKSFRGATFDGRYVYFVPSVAGSANAVTVRFDTTVAAGFGSTTAFTAFDFSTIDPTAHGEYQGAVFDGRYVYFVPSNNGNPSGVVVRFDALTPNALPTGYGASFY